MGRFDWGAAKAAVRTAGALMLGNVFVGYLIMDKTNWVNLAALLFFGASAIIVTSFERKV